MNTRLSKRAKEGNLEDRISSLPKNVLDNILDFLPVQDAARASILSRKWRYVLAEYPQLVLDEHFSSAIRQNRLPVEFTDDYPHTVNIILLQHFGPIRKIVLDLPELQSARTTHVDQWILFLSRKGVRELTLNDSSRGHCRIPSCIFSFHELEYLRMTKCVLRTPTAIGSFSKLTHLFLSKITFEPSFLRMPQLLIFSMKNCTGIRLLHVFAPLLQHLALFDNDDLRLDYYIICKDLAYTYVALSNAIQQCRFCAFFGDLGD
ncbi:F-box/FBD/LRR-repeat protein At1g13570-like [Coffea eugenioides]|uniref:F-box/FBD/LRR-repeat protein At1g13570-like n=1 Tax=Coffea eugenioides TaxID=49369 RepID=UPI000F60F611|nr:F-box/FBD/LRR-repeat protein At1g13570-like [Coffea eugenioides]